MTSVSFPFLVGQPDATTKAIPLNPAEFRFTTRSARRLEQACNGNIDTVIGRGKSVEACVLLVCYGLQWNDAAMTEDKATDLIDEFIAAGGDVIDLSRALYRALTESGVYGKPADPTTAATKKKARAAA